MRNQFYRQEDIDRLLKMLQVFEALDLKEKEDVEEIKLLLQKDPDIIDTKNPSGHITGSALVIDIASGTFLLHLHKKLNKWLQFGGHPDNETNPADVALRETSEETGLKNLYFYPNKKNVFPIDIEKQLIPAKKNNPEHYHYDFRYLLATNNPKSLNLSIDNESNSFKWVKFNSQEINTLHLDYALVRLIIKANNIWKKENGNYR